jgi:hypothetical protein
MRWKVTKGILGAAMVMTMLVVASVSPVLAHPHPLLWCHHANGDDSLDSNWKIVYKGGSGRGLNHYHEYLHVHQSESRHTHSVSVPCPELIRVIALSQGQATFTDNSDGSTQVDIDLGAKDERKLTATMHDLQGDSYNPEPTFRLNDVVLGTSTTTLKGSLEEFLATPRLILIQDETRIVAAGLISSH